MTLARAGTAVLAVLCCAAAAALGLSTMGGAVVATRGVSMNPVYHQGDLVVIAPAETYGVGDIAAFRSAQSDELVLHRIVGGDAAGFVFQGDNNASVDPLEPSAEQVIGRAVLHLPRAGTWLQRLLSPPAVAAYAFLLLMCGGRAVARTRRQRLQELREMSPRHRATPSRPSRLLPARLKPVAAGAAALSLVAVALCGIAWTQPVQQVVPTTDSVESSMLFSYAARVPASAAYDGTTVTAPQPVFRKLADSVDVSYRYAGSAGRLRVRAELSTAGGWTSIVPLGAPVTVATSFDGMVTLDLGALERRAAQAAEVTGVPVAGLTVAVVPSVVRDAGGEFAPRLELGLDPLVLKPLGELTSTQSTSAPGTRTGPAQLGALGFSADVTTVRTSAAATLLLSVLVSVVLVAAVRLGSPVTEADRVRRRHRDLIVTVLPVALTSGRPIVDVPDLDALVRVARGYALLVLTWSQGGLDTYVVRDEATTYRYRRHTPAPRAASQRGASDAAVGAAGSQPLPLLCDAEGGRLLRPDL